jgi:DeoR family transcriptional regulator, fructose operon transcriptional repressor
MLIITQYQSHMITHDKKDLAATRLERIDRILGQQRVIRVEDLCLELGVSAATIRRDLVELDRLGHLRKIHGGAMCVESRLDEPGFEDKAILAAKEKQNIAAAALRLVQQNDSVFLDGGSTVLALARLLNERKGVTVVTNSLQVASALSAGGPNMILIGGEFRRLSQTFVGSLTRPLVDLIHIDTAFIGTIGVSEKYGMTTTDPREGQTKEMIISHARQVVLLADSSKIGKVSFVRFSSLDRVNVLVTDSGAERDELRKLKKKGIKVVVA